MNSPFYRSEGVPVTNQRTDADQNETRASFITPARRLSRSKSPSDSDEAKSEEIKEQKSRKIFEGIQARSSPTRHNGSAKKSEEQEQKGRAAELENKQVKALKRRNNFLHELYAKEKEEFQQFEKRSNIYKVKFILEQTDTFMNFLLNVPKKKARQSTVMQFIKKGLSEKDILDTEEVEITKLTLQPSNLQNGVLKEYQLDALNWLIGLYERGLNGILADEMGLGKTIETISFIAYLRTIKIKGPFLIIVPLSTFYNWKKEFEKWCPEIRIFMLRAIKDREQENRLRFKERDFDVIITSYQGCIKSISKITKLFFKAIVIDEAHRMKNEETLLSNQVRKIQAHFRLLLTGTPMQNTLRELWALLNYIFPDIFANPEQFQNLLDLTQNKGKVVEEQIQKLHKILSFFMLRRTKADVLTEIPEKKEYIIKIPLSEQQVKLYRRLVVEVGRTGTLSHYRNVLMQLRKACQHPYLFADEVPFDGLVPLEVMIRASNKLALVDRLLAKFEKEGHQVLIFSQFVIWIECLEYYLDLKGIKYHTLVGSTSIEERQEKIEEFNSKDSKTLVFVLSTRAGGLGINLTSASKVIIFDSDFNPHTDIQAIDRCHRIGQTKVVEVFRFVSKDTVEENIIERQIIKLRLDELIVQQGRLAPKFKNLTNLDLQTAILHGADRFINNAVVPENVYDNKDFNLEQVLKDSEKQAKEWKKRVEDDIKDKLNEEILQDMELTYQKIQCLDDEAIKEREEIKERIKRQFVETITSSTSRRDRPYRGSIPPLEKIKVVSRIKIKYWQFPEKLELLKKLVQEDQQDLDRILKIEETGFTAWSKQDTQNLIKGIGEEGSKNYKALKNYVRSIKSETEIKEYIEVMLERREELNECGLYTSLQKALFHFQEKSEQADRIERYIQIYKQEQNGERPKLSYISPIARQVLVLTYELGYGKWDAIRRRILMPKDLNAGIYFDTVNLFEGRAFFKQLVENALRKLKKNGFKEKVDRRSKSREREQHLTAELQESSDEKESVQIGAGMPAKSVKPPRKEGVKKKLK